MVTANCTGCPKPKAAIPVEGLDCAGQKVTIINPPSKPAPTQTVAHPDSVQRVLICNPSALGGGGGLAALQGWYTDGGEEGGTHQAIVLITQLGIQVLDLAGTDVTETAAAWGLGAVPIATNNRQFAAARLEFGASWSIAGISGGSGNVYSAKLTVSAAGVEYTNDGWVTVYPVPVGVFELCNGDTRTNLSAIGIRTDATGIVDVAITY